MKATSRLAVVALAVVALLAPAHPAHATIFRRRVAYRPYFPPNHMPGWDWWRTYPYSPYNYGRNPYNPIFPYPVPPGPFYLTPTVSAYPAQPPAPNIGTGITNSPVSVSPTPTTGVVRVLLPDTFASVQFNGEPISGVGSTRYYVSPPMQAGQVNAYNITASWTGDVGQPVTQHRIAKVSPGQTTVVDFGRP
jgi:uncharacterized protein (TIGR03000 family)